MHPGRFSGPLGSKTPPHGPKTPPNHDFGTILEVFWTDFGRIFGIILDVFFVKGESMKYTMEAGLAMGASCIEDRPFPIWHAD